jgi:hypothetical protein
MNIWDVNYSKWDFNHETLDFNNEATTFSRVSNGDFQPCDI